MGTTRADFLSGRSVACLAALLVATGLGLRLYGFALVGIDHFDEGVYAFSADGIASGLGWDGLFARQERFSPPVYFGGAALLKALLGGPADRILIGLSVAAGTATIALAWSVARRWIGPAAGLAATTLLAWNEFHVVVSRAALTDALFALLYLGSVLVLAEALERRSLRLAVLGGVITGLAWNTKYHGWFALVTTGLALLPVLWAARRSGLRDLAGRLGPWLVAAAVAAACYLPWALYVESRPGGYAALAEYQQTMLRSEWLDNLLRHWSQQHFFDGAWSRAALPAALAAALLAQGGRAALGRTAIAILLVTTAAAGLGQALAVPVLALLGAVTLLPRLRDVRIATLLSGLLLWTVMTPFYQPYARLYLPLAIGLMLLAGAGIAWIAARLVEPDGSRLGSALALLGAVAVAVVSGFQRTVGDPWKPARGAETAARALAERIEPGARVIVLGEPSLAFYLAALGYRAKQTIQASALPDSLPHLQERAWIVGSIYSQRTGGERRALDALGARIEHVATVPFEVRDLRLLDDFRVPAAKAFRRAPTGEYALRLYRWNP